MDDSARFCPNCGAAATVPPPAPAPEIATPTAPPVAPMQPAVRYGGFWIRFVAIIVDALVVTVIIAPIYFVVFVGVAGAGYAVGMPWGGRHMVMWIAGRGLWFFAWWLYEALMWSSSREATLGKMLFHLRVTDEAGNRISFARATGRHFAKYLSALFLFIGYIIAGFTARHQALHDMIARTLVRRD